MRTSNHCIMRDGREERHLVLDYNRVFEEKGRERLRLIMESRVKAQDHSGH